MLMLSIFTAILTPAVDSTGKFEAPRGDVAVVTQALGEALRVLGSSDSSDEDKRRTVSNAMAIAKTRLARHSLVAERLASSNNDNAEDVLREAFEMLSFVPIHESDLPEGAPTYTPVGVIELKQYPMVRKAVAGGFFTLFSHIKKNNIAMTAPVQMELELSDSGRMKQKNMAFFYGSTNIGKTGRDGRVEVVEVEPVSVVSTGVRGRRNNEVIRDRIARLQNWIESHVDYEAAGPIRLMGYNSPFVPASKQFYEVQIPVRKVAATVSASP